MAKTKKNLQLITAGTPEGHQKNSQLTFAAIESSVQEKRALYRPLQQRGGELKKKGEILTRVHLVNRLNFTNFQGGTILVNFKHRKYDRIITLLARPQPCMGELLDCVWAQPDESYQIKQFYEFKNFLLIDGKQLLLVKPELLRLDKEGISVILPELCYEVCSRSTARHLCQGITVQFIQNSSLFSGALLDFNVCSLRVELTAVPPQTFDWINPEAPVNIVLSKNQEPLYAGECRVIRQTSNEQSKTFILEPLKFEIQRFKHKEYRSYRYALTPSPNILFRHPFTNSVFNLKVIDLSGVGFSVEEDVNNAVLLPGLILPKVALSFAHSFKIECRAQVIYRKIIENEKSEKLVKCGLALLDIDIQDHVKLLSLLHQTRDKDAYICNTVNMDDLWDFFFETGFIYPDKYSYIQKNKNDIKKTYEKIYTENPHIARHFTYQEKGRIMGHMAMIRFYHKTWLIQHHAARRSALNKAGLIVLDQIGRLGNASHRLLSLHMDYLMCYYQPENRFPSRVFGGAAKNINDPKGCSVDTFAYFHHCKDHDGDCDLPKPWELTQIYPQDLQELENFYRFISGGCMIDALDLKPNKLNIDNLAREYTQLGLKRGRHLFSLRKIGLLKAVIMVNLADLGLNLSDLTNCITIFILDETEFSKDIFAKAVSIVANTVKQDGMPVLLYPATFADNKKLQYEKHYNLWIINLQYTDPYFKYLNRLLRFI